MTPNKRRGHSCGRPQTQPAHAHGECCQTASVLLISTRNPAQECAQNFQHALIVLGSVVCGLTGGQRSQNMVATGACTLNEDLPSRLQVGDPRDGFPQLLLLLPTACRRCAERTVVIQRGSEDFDAFCVPHLFPRSSMPGGHSEALFHTRLLPPCNRMPANAPQLFSQHVENCARGLGQ